MRKIDENIIKRMNFIVGGVLIAFGLKLMTFLDGWVLLPFFPNFIDFFAMFLIGAFLMFQYVIR